MYAIALAFEERHLHKPLLQLWAAMFQDWVNFTPLLFLSDKAGCATFQAHTCRARKLAIDKTICANPRAQPTNIFGGGGKWCNLLLYLTNSYVCENFGGEQLSDCPLSVRGPAQILSLFLCSCDLRCSSAGWILLPVLFISRKPGCASFEAHTCRQCRDKAVLYPLVGGPRPFVGTPQYILY